jgi:hypothetical protein
MTVLEQSRTEERSTYAPPAESGGPPPDWQPYRAVSRSAVIALVLGVLGSTLGLLFPSMLALCAIGLISGVIGLRSIKKHPLEYTGLGVAKLGIIFSLIGFIAGVGIHTAVFLTEVPDGLERVYFWELRPGEEGENAEHIASLQGKKIFIKGYVHPGVQGMGSVKHFILVGDMGTCCFGGQPNMFDMVEVKLDTADGIYYSTSLRKFGGTFEIQPPRKVETLANVVYKLDANYVK